MRHFRKRDRSDMLAKVNFGAIKSITCYKCDTVRSSKAVPRGGR